MDWVKEFYATQNEWFGVYLGDISPSHHMRASLVQQMTGTETKKILELGAGGGQTAIALGQLGHEITMIELLQESAQHAQELSQHYHIDLRIFQTDFYTLDLDEQFDLVCYFDSFGIGTDADQRRLLCRIADWLQPNGAAIVEIGSTWYWGGIGKGKSLDLGDCIRQYDFDAVQCQLIDNWWRKGNPAHVVSQYLRCYTPADLNLLLEGTGLSISAIESGGRIDYNANQFIPKVRLKEAMTYYVKLEKS